MRHPALSFVSPLARLSPLAPLAPLALLALTACTAKSDKGHHATNTDDTSADASDTSDTSDSGGDDTSTDSGLPDGVVHIPLASLEAFSYTMDLGVGTGTFAEIIDTGSTTAAVASTGCCRGVSPLYSPGTGATDKSKSVDATYADGSGWSGEVYEDQASVPGLPDVSLSFVAISEESDFFWGNDYQGIVGLGPDELLYRGTTSWMSLLAHSGVTEEMAFRLCNNSGDMWVGGYDTRAAASTVKYTPMVAIDGYENPYYSIDLDDVGFGGSNLGLDTSDLGHVILDTGTSISYIPTPAEDKMLDAINNNAAFQSLFPDSTLADSSRGSCVSATGVDAAMVDATLPPLVFTLPSTDGSTFTVELAPTRSYLYEYSSGRTSQFCWAISSSGDGGRWAYSLFGDTMLAGLLTVFDVAQERVGVAPEAGCSSSFAPQVAPPPQPGVPWFEGMPHFRGPPAALLRRGAAGRAGTP